MLLHHFKPKKSLLWFQIRRISFRKSITASFLDPPSLPKNKRVFLRTLKTLKYIRKLNLTSLLNDFKARELTKVLKPLAKNLKLIPIPSRFLKRPITLGLGPELGILAKLRLLPDLRSTRHLELQFISCKFTKKFVNNMRRHLRLQPFVTSIGVSARGHPKFLPLILQLDPYCQKITHLRIFNDGFKCSSYEFLAQTNTFSSLKYLDIENLYVETAQDKVKYLKH